VLSQNIERAGAVEDGILRALPRRFECRPALQHLETVTRHQDRFGRLVETMIGASDPLDQPARPLRRADVDDEVDVAPVDAEVQRRRRDHRFEPAGRHRRFDLPTLLGVERAMVKADRQVVVVDPP